MENGKCYRPSQRKAKQTVSKQSNSEFVLILIAAFFVVLSLSSQLEKRAWNFCSNENWGRRKKAKQNQIRLQEKQKKGGEREKNMMRKKIEGLSLSGREKPCARSWLVMIIDTKQ